LKSTCGANAKKQQKKLRRPCRYNTDSAAKQYLCKGTAAGSTDARGGFAPFTLHTRQSAVWFYRFANICKKLQNSPFSCARH